MEVQIAQRVVAPRVPRAEVIERLAYRFGRSYDAYLVTEPDRRVFYARDGQGAVAYAPSGRNLYVNGGLLAAEQSQSELLENFVRYAERADCTPAFFNIHEQELPLFHEHGFQATKWGEEAIVDLHAGLWHGRSFAWVRQQANSCRREDVVVEECPWRALSDQRWEAVQRELAAVSAASLSSNPQRGEINLLEGHFVPARMARRRLFIARADNGRGAMEGFLVCHPCLDGARWVFETYRHRPDARRGVCATLMYTAMRVLADEAVESVSLCLVPGLRCHQGTSGDSALVRWGLVLGTKYFNFIHDTAGMYHFKTRFRPRFENRYLCVRPRVSLSWAWRTVRDLGVLRLDSRVLAADLVARLRKRAARKTLKPLAQ